MKQPEETRDQPASHVRIGWGQAYGRSLFVRDDFLAVLQACLGYTKFSYSWRSHKGTIFHEARGKHYMDGGFKEGDVLGRFRKTLSDEAILGCLIDLPELDEIPRKEFSDFLPPAYKELALINFKSHLFYEEKEELAEEMKKLKSLKNSRVSVG